MDHYRYYGVLLPIPIEQPVLIYRIASGDADPDLLLGRVVMVPLGRSRMLSGVVWSYLGTIPTGQGVKEIDTVLTYPQLPLSTRRFWEWMASYYMCSLGDVLRAALPQAFRPEGDQAYVFVGMEEYEDDDPQVTAFVKEQGTAPFTLAELRQALGSQYSCLFARWVGEDLVVPEDRGVMTVREQTGWGISEGVGDPEFLRRVRDALKRSKKGLAALELILSEDYHSWYSDSLTDLSSLLNVSTAVIRRLRDLGVVVRMKRPSPAPHGAGEHPSGGAIPDYRGKDILLLHLPHTRALERIPLRHLYDQLSERGGQYLLLFPTITMLEEANELLEKAFGKSLYLYHTSVTQGVRQRTYLSAWSGRAGIYVGLHAAIWLPLSDLREVVILDGEHQSYRQLEPAPRYTASDAALVLAGMSRARSLLVSASPSVESYAQTLRGKYAVQTESAPRQPSVMPQVVSMKDAFDDNRVHARLLSDVMVEGIRQTIASRGQVLLLYQRPGYARAVQCSACGESLKCPRCHSVLRVYDSDGTQAACPVCGYSMSLQDPCPSCGRTTLKAQGTGIELLAEAIRRFFRGMSVTTVNEDKKEIRGDILLYNAYDPPLLLLHQVGMVGIVQLDLMLTLPDHRSGERAFRTLQMCRDEMSLGGRLVIQYFAKSTTLDAFLQDDYRMMVDYELAERHQMLFPPFCRHIDVVLEHREQSPVASLSTQLSQGLMQALPQVSVLAPTPVPVRKRAYHYGYRIGLLIPLDAPLGTLKRRIDEIVRRHISSSGLRSVNLYYDVDP